MSAATCTTCSSVVKQLTLGPAGLAQVLADAREPPAERLAAVQEGLPVSNADRGSDCSRDRQTPAYRCHATCCHCLPSRRIPPLQHLSCTVQGPSFQHVLLSDMKHMYIIQQVAHRPPLLTPARQA